MKKASILLVLLASIISSCNTKKCDFTDVLVTTSIDGNELQRKEFSDCFVKKTDKDVLQLTEIVGEKSKEKFNIKYYPDGSMLNVRIGDKLTEWRRNKGHNIYIIQEPDTLALVFGDNTPKKNSVSVLVRFVKK